MKTKQERKDWAVCSGEGERGTVKRVTATETGIKRILTRERCGGDRWARATLIVPGEKAKDADGRGLMMGFDY